MKQIFDEEENDLEPTTIESMMDDNSADEEYEKLQREAAHDINLTND
jgi:hypothetical protein